MDKNIIKLIALEQKKAFGKMQGIVVRNIPEKFIASKKIGAITGIRRSGKSTLLKQISLSVGGYHYFNFEDERLLDFTYKNFNLLYEVLLELFGEHRIFFFDEIQKIAEHKKCYYR